MASAQCHKPSEKTHHNQVHKNTEINHEKNHNTNEHSFTDKLKEKAHFGHKKTEIHHDKDHSTNEHSFTDKVKGMAHKMFNHHEHPKVPNHAQEPTPNCSTGTAHYGEEKKMKPRDGRENHCMPNMLDHMKRKKKKSKARKHSGSGTDSGSSSDSDN